jgi:hypothetical protein
MERPAQPSRMPDGRIAVLSLPPSRFLKIQPKVRVSASIGMTIIMFRTPR